MCLGYSELSLTEGLDSLVQPVGSPDGSLSLVLNGEIYNCQELRELLIDNVEIDKEAGDCEILMRLIGEIHEGNLQKTIQSVLKLLNGMYALAVTDSKEIVIARDPMEKPFIQSGKDFPIFEVDDTSFGVLVCFEIAFPELTRIIALKSTAVIFVPASVSEESDYLWDARLKARAIDNHAPL